MVKRILLIGIDGGSWNILEPLMKWGVMPTLKTLSEKGFRTTLFSTDPPLTAPAWVSLMTGKHPEKHLIFDFLQFDKKGKKVHLVNSTHIEGETIWEILSRHNKKVVSLFFPYTYPPMKINGIIVSGFDTPSMESEFTYPPHLRKDLLSHYPQLDVTTGKLIKMFYSPENRDMALEEAKNSLDTKLSVALYLLDKVPDYTLFGVQIQESDTIQHILWNEIEQMLKNENSPVSRELKEFYSLIDYFIKTLIEKSNADMLLIVSDHGFMRRKRIIYPNYILFKEGLISMKLPYRILWEMRRTGKVGNFIADILKNVRKWIVNSIRKTPETSAIEKALIPSLHDAWRRIKWEKTKAMVVFGQYAGWGYIFSKDKMMVINKLKEIEKRYKDYLEEIIFFDDNPPNKCHPDFSFKLIEGDIVSELIWLHPSTLPVVYGTHSKNGIFLTTPPFKSSYIKEVHITDICPTILHSLSLPIPNDIDGKVIEGLTNKEKMEDEQPLKEKRTPLPSEEEEKILERLKDLGYIE